MNKETEMVEDTNGRELIDRHLAFIKNIEEILSTFKDLKEEMEKYELKKNVSKTVGTSAAALGAVGTVAGVGLAVFTGGLSLALTVSSIAATGVGAAVNITTDIIDHFESKGFYKKINNLVKEYDSGIKTLESFYAELHSFANEFKEEHKVDDTTAWYVVLHVPKKFAKVSALVNNSVKAPRMLQAASLLKQLKSVGTVTKTATGGMEFVLSTTALTAQQTKNFAKVVGSDVVKFAPSAGKAALHGAVALGSVVVTLWEIKTLIDDWNKSHPTIQAADKVINELLKTKKILKNTVQILETTVRDG